MTARLASRIEVSALIRRVEGLGGTGMVLARGDGEAGAILLLLSERGEPHMLLQKILDSSQVYRWQRTGPQDVEDKQSLNIYMERQRQFDPDLWLVELDIVGAERFADEMIREG